MKIDLPFKAFLVLAVFLRLGGLVYGQNATSVTGLYYTGIRNNGNLLGNNSPDPHWAVTYASFGGVENTAYEGSAYVVSPVAGGWVGNTSTAQWVTAPGAGTGGSLPGNGTTGTNSAYYVYRLAFNILGTGSGVVQNNVSITLTIAADDQYTVYVNPSSAPTVDINGTINSGGTASSGSRTSAWTASGPLAVQNYGAGTANNAQFVIGTNYLYIVVANTNSQTGNNGSGALNPSGLFVYQTSSSATVIGPPVVPEVATWMPVVLAFGLFVRQRYFRRSKAFA